MRSPRRLKIFEGDEDIYTATEAHVSRLYLSYSPAVFEVATMKSLPLALAFAASLVSASAIVFPTKDNAPSLSEIAIRSDVDFSQDSLSSRHNRKKDNWGNALEKYREKVTLRASKDDYDDVSDDFLRAIKKANNGGLVHLKKGHKYVIGKKLDLTFLKDIYIKIDGELKVRNETLA
jgi:galacturan 1,4-alpha-galacturonidase